MTKHPTRAMALLAAALALPLVAHAQTPGKVGGGKVGGGKSYLKDIEYQAKQGKLELTGKFEEVPKVVGQTKQ